MTSRVLDSRIIVSNTNQRFFKLQKVLMTSLKCLPFISKRRIQIVVSKDGAALLRLYISGYVSCGNTGSSRFGRSRTRMRIPELADQALDPGHLKMLFEFCSCVLSNQGLGYFLVKHIVWE